MMMFINWLRRITAGAVWLLAALLLASSAGAAVPYEGYSYDGWSDRIPTPVAYVPERTVTGEALGIGTFRSPEDVFVTSDKRIFIADTGGNRIVELNDRYEFVRQIDKFIYDGKEETFSKPQGVFVTGKGEVIVADTAHNRVVRLDGEGKADLIVTAPKSEFFAKDFIFEPKKVVVDSADRIYVIAGNVFDGIMQFDGKGEFVNFYGANRVKYSVADYIWKKYLSTGAQRERMVSFVPTEYTNLDVDESGFIFTTTADNSGAAPKPIARHNPTGSDVLLRQGFANPMGDVRYNPTSGPSRLVDIDVGADGSYSALDNKRGRIFTYDSEGKLLYIFGETGDRVGSFQFAEALERVGESFIVLDKNLNRLTVFQVSRFGQLVNEAVHYHYIGNEEKAAAIWKEVLSLDANFDLAYSGVSKSLLRSGDDKLAMKNAKLGLDRHAYSKAYQRYRKDVLKTHFSTILTTALIAAIAWVVWAQYRNYRKRKGGASRVDRAS
jgi:hypothetical protein